MAGQGQTGVRRIISATFNSIAGFKAAWKHEAAFRQECALAVVMLPAAFWVGETAVERGVLIGSCLLVIIVELLNTAIEATVDRIGMERHDLSGRAKDIGSAAVFLALLLMAITWGLIAWENFA
jgi:diacylglycerol kinase (ATP)